MGYSISWIALRNKAPEEAAQLLGLSFTGETEEVPESMFSGMKLGTGWYLVVINRHGHRLVQEKSLKEISASCEVIAASIEEHVMSCAVQCWKNGRLQWAVAHESETGIDHLEERGTLPVIYRPIKDRLLVAQKTADGVDYVFDVPLELTEAIV